MPASEFGSSIRSASTDDVDFNNRIVRSLPGCFSRQQACTGALAFPPLQFMARDLHRRRAFALIHAARIASSTREPCWCMTFCTWSSSIVWLWIAVRGSIDGHDGPGWPMLAAYHRPSTRWRLVTWLPAADSTVHSILIGRMPSRRWTRPGRVRRVSSVIRGLVDLRWVCVVPHRATFDRLPSLLAQPSPTSSASWWGSFFVFGGGGSGCSMSCGLAVPAGFGQQPADGRRVCSRSSIPLWTPGV